MTLLRTQTLKIAYAGQGGLLSSIPLKGLIDIGLSPEAIIIPQQPLPKGLSLLKVQPPLVEDGLAKIAINHDIRLIEWQKGCVEEIEAKLTDIKPDLVIMSCFPWRIPKSLLNIPPLGWWNLHPSLLPAYRGPTPLFWQTRAGETQVGVTLHQVDPALDSGDILNQQTVPLLDFNGEQLEAELAHQGARLIEQTLAELAQGKLKPMPQAKLEASYQGFPHMQDFYIATTGAASKAYRFIKLMGQRYPLIFQLNAKQFRVLEAVSVDEQGQLDESYQFKDNQCAIQFEQGILVVLVEEQK